MEALYAIATVLIGGFVNFWRGGNFRRHDNVEREWWQFLPGGIPSAAIAAIILGVWCFYIFPDRSEVAPGITLPVLFGAAIAVSFFLWELSGWGRWITLGRFRPSAKPLQPEAPDEYPQKAPSWHERAIDGMAARLPGSHDHWGLLIRFAYATPLLLAVSYAFALPAMFWAAIAAPFGLLLAYDVAWRLWDRGKTLFDHRHAIDESELYAGFVWGGLIAAGIYL